MVQPAGLGGCRQIALISGNLMRKWKDEKMEMGMSCLLVFIGLAFYTNLSCLWMNVITFKRTFKSLERDKKNHIVCIKVKIYIRFFLLQAIKQNIYRKHLMKMISYLHCTNPHVTDSKTKRRWQWRSLWRSDLSSIRRNGAFGSAAARWESYQRLLLAQTGVR